MGHIEVDSLLETNGEDEQEGAEEERESDNTHFRKLLEFLDIDNTFQPIDVPVKVSVAELLLMLVKYTLVCSIGLSAVASLFLLINSIFARSVIPESRYLIDKLFNPCNSITFHGLCTECGMNLGTFKRLDSKKHCNLCNAEINVQDTMYKDFFVTLDPSSQIADLLAANSNYYNEIMNERQPGENVLRDIYDGKLYRRFVNDLLPAVRNRYVSVTFNTDGAPLFESSSYSIWPVYLMINELPIAVRTTELIVVGLWFGKNKPNMNVF